MLEEYNSTIARGDFGGKLPQIMVINIFINKYI